MQMELAHANRVATIGQLTASIAHEVNQPITAARNYADSGLRFLSMDPPDLKEVREALDCIMSNADRAGEIIGRIRAQVRKAPPQSTSFDVNDAINELIALTRSDVVEKGVTVNVRLAEGLSTIQGDRVQLQQVVLNLILNADEILVAVGDSGPGIDPDHLTHVFDSFYTTKSSGMGLGLSICRSIIETHGGRLWADVKASRGAVFQFALPAGNVDS
jgi:C4-dicarboxylate-specific signal transduction histidine kinase